MNHQQVREHLCMLEAPRKPKMKPGRTVSVTWMLSREGLPSEICFNRLEFIFAGRSSRIPNLPFPSGGDRLLAATAFRLNNRLK